MARKKRIVDVKPRALYWARQKRLNAATTPHEPRNRNVSKNKNLSCPEQYVSGRHGKRARNFSVFLSYSLTSNFRQNGAGSSTHFLLNCSGSNNFPVWRKGKYIFHRNFNEWVKEINFKIFNFPVNLSPILLDKPFTCRRTENSLLNIIHSAA